MQRMVPEYWSDATQQLSAVDPVMADLIRQYEGELLYSQADPFYTLARAITGQQISVKAADAVWAKLQAALGEVTPAMVLDAEDDVLRGAGLSRSKIRYLRGIAEAFVSGDLQPARWGEMSDHEVVSDLVRLPGVGRWTAEMFLIFHMLRPDVFPRADLGMIKAIRQLYGEERAADLEALEALWSPWRTVATWYLWRSLDPVPVQY